ncbi:hypothetical protein BV22DRAFT_1040329 [Leucogyrophana mollusca]|uniref:Uncharacterized protein n=1 Tax=Leucogyrophana mollusca TaxID=85980 RepID=A0ACB8B453_9AGAM|nr:hypothetical protein BV22DRAFT_1040329 [Leucogyrophana mollusca]
MGVRSLVNSGVKLAVLASRQLWCLSTRRVGCLNARWLMSIPLLPFSFPFLSPTQTASPTLTEQPHGFLSSLPPSTPETTAHVLRTGWSAAAHGYPTAPAVSPRRCPCLLITLPRAVLPNFPLFAYASSTHTTHAPDPHFTGLLAQTRSYLLSPDFAAVLEAALDRATEVLIEGLRGQIFVDSAGGMNDGTVVGGGDEARGGDVGENVYSQLQRASAREEEVKVRLTSLLPSLARWSQLALKV